MILDLPPDAYGVLRDLQSGFTRFDLYFMKDKIIAVKTISSRAVFLSALLGGFIGMMLIGSREEAKRRQKTMESLAEGRIESVADFAIPYGQVLSAEIKKGYFAGSLTMRLPHGKSRKLTFASDKYPAVLELTKTLLGDRVTT